MNKEEVARKLAKMDQLLNELIFAFMQTGMTYKQAEEEVFRMLKRKRLSKLLRNARAERARAILDYPPQSRETG
jgi:hypothetical protein